MSKRKSVLIQWAAHFCVLLVWELLSRYVVPPQFLPSPGAIVRALVATTLSGELPRQLWQSARVLVAGFGLAVVCGMAIGIAMGMFRTLRRILDPYVNAFYAMPTVALIPLVIIWLGLGFQAKVFLTWLVAVFPVIINAEIGVASVPAAFIETARAFGCNRWQVFRRVILHAAVPFFMAGIRLGLGRALIGVVVAEMFTALAGLGYMIVLYGNTFRTAELFVPILVLAVISVAITNLLRRIERKIAPWRSVENRALLRRRFLMSMAVPVVRARAMTTVKIATAVTPPSIHNIFLHVAHERGFFRANGIDVTEFIQLRGGPLATQAIAAGRVDIAPADPEGLLGAVLSGHALRAVAAPGARLSYMVAVRKEIRTVADLRGQPFAISRPGAISQYLMYPLLDREGVPRDSLQWFGVGGALERMLALKAGRVKGALLMVDFAMEAGNDPNIRILKSVADTLPNYPVELLVLRKDMLDNRPEAAVAITRAVIQACRYIVKEKKGTVDVVLKYAPGIDRTVLDRAYDELIRIQGFGVNGGMTEANMKVAHDLALQNRQIGRPIALDQWAEFRCQERVIAQLGRFAG